MRFLLPLAVLLTVATARVKVSRSRSKSPITGRWGNRCIGFKNSSDTDMAEYFKWVAKEYQAAETAENVERFRDTYTVTRHKIPGNYFKRRRIAPYVAHGNVQKSYDDIQTQAPIKITGNIRQHIIRSKTDSTSPMTLTVTNPGSLTTVNNDDCGLKIAFPSTDKCWKKWDSYDLKKVCSPFAYPKSKNNVWNRFTSAECSCDENHRGDGFACSRPCDPETSNAMLCTGNFQCFAHENGTAYCGCYAGFVRTPHGECKPKEDVCRTCRHSCHGASKCISPAIEPDLYSCSDCNEKMGYRGRNGQCANINECREGTHNCDVNALCADQEPLQTGGYRYRCKCKPGWTANPNAGTKCTPCVDENECAKDICGPNSICTNTPGSYSCQCKPGFEPGANKSCIDIDECNQLPCLANSECKNTYGSYECPCVNGFVGNGKYKECKPDPKICKSCDKRTTTCKLNSKGTKYRCSCNKFHERISSTQCQPIKYCHKPEAIKCAPAPKAKCTDRPDGSGYDCQCNEGFTGNGTHCYEIDICKRTNPCLYVSNTICESDPSDPANKYKCVCKPGHVRQLAGVGNNTAPCFDVVSFMANNCTACDKRTEECYNVTGEGIREGDLKACRCADGYERRNDGYCRDINECIDPKLNDCDAYKATCINADPYRDKAKFRCKCQAGYTGTGKKDSCKDIDECKNPNTCDRTTQICKNLVPGYECKCKDGFMPSPQDPTRCVDVDECLLYLHKCNPHSVCNNTVGSYRCTCAKGYRERAERNKQNGNVECDQIDFCKEGHMGTGKPVCEPETEICVAVSGGFDCLCKPGFKNVDNRCIDINECADNMLNDCDLVTTTCKNIPGSYECACKAGFEKPFGNNSAKYCIDIDECRKKTFTCHPHSHCINSIGSYSCVCDDGFQNERNTNLQRPYCTRISVCTSALCNGGSCVDVEEPPFFKCNCQYGTVSYNETQCIDTKYCDSTGVFPCPRNSKCAKNKKCECDVGYKWKDLPLPLTLSAIKTDRQCTEIDWCAQVGKKQCKGMKCRNTPDKGAGTGECFCDDGFELIEGKCEDKNECQAKDICPKHSSCDNTVGSYMCLCDKGYYKDPKSSDTNPKCIDIDECKHKRHNCTAYQNTICENTDGGFTCNCLPGFKRDQIGNDRIAANRFEIRHCVDINECETEVCDEVAECTNTPGSFSCKCPKGFIGRGLKDKVCQDIDECEQGMHNCTMRETCINTRGSFKCVCKDGFRMERGKCTNIDECIEQPDICGKNDCRDDKPGFACICPEGFYNKSGECEDINECKYAGKCNKGVGVVCLNTIGSYKCTCKPGFSHEHCHSEKDCRCEDKDECAEGINDGERLACGKNTVCNNTIGSYHCKCKEFHTGDPYAEKGCTYVDICTREPCKDKNSDCQPVDEFSKKCICKKGFIMNLFNGLCEPDPCKEKPCAGGSCAVEPDTNKKKMVARCICPVKMVEKKGNCVDGDLCKCGEKPEPCRGSPACSDPDRMDCFMDDVAFKAECRCLKQFKFNSKTKKCDETDLCNPSPCPSQATCKVIKDEKGVNQSYTCTCPIGMYYEVDKFGSGSCKNDIDCVYQGRCYDDLNKHCVNRGDRSVCECKEGMVLDPIKLKCMPEDACVKFRKANNGKPRCPENAIEFSQGLECYCKCFKGFEKHCFNETEVCLDVNECLRDPCRLNTTAPECVNTVGSYHCACGELRKDYSVQNGKCQPTNKCISKKIACGLNARCIPETGKCECDKGFKRYNTTDCENIDECLEGKYNCPPYSYCVDTVGSYKCECQAGYHRSTEVKANGFDYSCVNTNECEENNNACPEGSVCEDVEGSFKCICKPPLIQHGIRDCAYNTTNGCHPGCGEHAHCIKLKTVDKKDKPYNCSCDYGYEGDPYKGCTQMNLCEPNPCIKGKCENVPGNYRCICEPPFREVARDECGLINYCAEGSPCPRNSKCIQLKTPRPKFPKTDAKAWVDCKCEELGMVFNPDTFQCDDVNECEQCKDYPHCPCPKIATQCINTQGSFKCLCPEGYTYDVIENECVDINECEKNLAYTCTQGECVNTIGSWYCKCNVGFKNPKTSNQTCEIDHFCNTKRDTCDKKTTKCIEKFPGFSCQCLEGYQPDPEDPNKCLDINECKTNPKACDEMTELCVNEVPGYKCVCANEYEIGPSGKCEQAGKCKEKCMEYAQCLKTRDGSHKCVCMTGYALVDNNKTCSVIGCDQAKNCPPHSVCTSVQYRNATGVPKDRYECVCQEGYVMDPKTYLCRPPPNPCAKVDCGTGVCEALTKPPFYKCNCPMNSCKNVSCTPDMCDKNATCVKMSETSLICKCNEGFTGLGTPAHGCKPINPCDEATCSMYASCQVVDGQAKCVCDSHYRGNGTYCTDINECIESAPDGQKLHKCDPHAQCENYQGGYNCKCDKGYTGSGMVGECVDVDECTDPALDKCDDCSTNCHNDPGSFHCTCKDGYRNVTYPFHKCEDINECKENPKICGIHTCNNLIPFFSCICNKGYTVQADGKTCVDDDECLLKTHQCVAHSICVNYEGGHNCVCEEGYTGDGHKKCELIDRCKDPELNNCDEKTTNCYMYPDKPKYRCDCKKGYMPPPGQSEPHRCIDKNECENGEAKFDSDTTECKNLPGTYELYCKPGYENKHSNPSPHNVDCQDKDECGMDPAYWETVKKLNSTKYKEEDWQKLMVKPKVNNSGYAHCYYAALSGVTFQFVTLPMCKNLPPKQPMTKYITYDDFDFPTGYECTCLSQKLHLDHAQLNPAPVCERPTCQCVEGFICKNGVCVCENPKHRIKLTANGVSCTDHECDKYTPYPLRITDPEKYQRVTCSKGIFVAEKGFKLVRDNTTGEVIDVVDIDECKDLEVDPCCDFDKCTGPDCVKCLNTVGSFVCRTTSSNRTCDVRSIDKDKCCCAEPQCQNWDSWFYNCQTQCNATSHPDLSKPEFNKKVCTKFKLTSEKNLLTVNNLRELYEYLCELVTTSTDPQNKYACFFDARPDDLTRTPAFNYWGECQTDISKVKCVEGTPFTTLTGAIVCPTRCTPSPENQPIGNPKAQDFYPVLPECYKPSIQKMFSKGIFSISKESRYGRIGMI